MRRTGFFWFFGFLVGSIYAQPISLVRDFNPGYAASYFGEFTSLPSGKTLFAVTLSSPQSEGLWVTDGSPAGTEQLRNYPGGVSGMIPYKNRIYYYGPSPNIIWRTDGTKLGTDSIPIAGLTSYRYLGVYIDLLFFVATNSQRGTELWRTDGTTQGTFMVKDLWMGTNSSMSHTTTRLIEFNGDVYFSGNNGFTGNELWKSNGDLGNMHLVKDINPGSSSSTITLISNQLGHAPSCQDGFYFYADDGTHGSELWFSGGTAAKTILTGDLVNSVGFYVFHTDPVFINQRSYFGVDKSLFMANGVPDQLQQIVLYTSPTPSTGLFANCTSPFVSNDALYYFTITGQSISTNSIVSDTIRLYRVDSTLLHRDLIFTLPLARSQYASAYYFGYLSCNDKRAVLVLNGKTDANQIRHRDLLIVNLETGQHNLIKDCLNLLGPDSPPLVPVWLDEHRAYFPAFGDSTGFEPCLINLDSITLKRIKPSSLLQLKLPYYGYVGCEITRLYDKYYFPAFEPWCGLELFETDFTDAGTNAVMDLFAGPQSCLFYGPGVPYGGTHYMNCWNTGATLLLEVRNGTNGRELFSLINAQNPVLIDEEKKYLGVSVFPNPGSGKFELKSSVPMSGLQIFSTSGQEIIDQRWSASYEAEFQVTGLNPGLYILQIHTHEGIKTKKLLID